MNPEIKAKWLEALRSGKYKQGFGALHSKDEYCCLGVLCDIAVKSGLGIRVYKYDDGSVEYDDELSLLPESVKTWAELSESNPKINIYTVLSDVNDGSVSIERQSFAEIAGLIQEWL